MSRTCACSIVSAVTTDTAIGISCNVCWRLAAVTMTSSSMPLLCASAGSAAGSMSAAVAIVWGSAFRRMVNGDTADIERYLLSFGFLIIDCILRAEYRFYSSEGQCKSYKTVLGLDTLPVYRASPTKRARGTVRHCLNSVEQKIEHVLAS